MNNITIEVNKLLPIVLENKQKHDNVYQIAVSGYWVNAEKVLNEKLGKIQNKEKIEPYLGLTFPVNHSDDYDRVIRMLELSANSKIDLNSNQFDAYVRNQWSWKNEFLTICSGHFAGNYVF